MMDEKELQSWETEPTREMNMEQLWALAWECEYLDIVIGEEIVD